MSKFITYNDIFAAPQGEGLFTGMPMVFVRLQGCNLGCVFCDTLEAVPRGAGTVMDASRLAHMLVSKYPGRRAVCFTGGEPLIQTGPVIECSEILHEEGWKVHLETNGTITLLPHQLQYFDWITVSPKGPRWTLSVPGKAVSELKFVMPPKDEYDADMDGKVWAGSETIKAFVEACPTAFLWFQPRDNEPAAIEWCLRLLDVCQAVLSPAPLTMGLSVQVHKYIGSK